MFQKILFYCLFLTQVLAPVLREAEHYQLPIHSFHNASEFIDHCFILLTLVFPCLKCLPEGKIGQFLTVSKHEEKINY